MADIVVKQSNGAADATYSKLVPSAGDSSPAIWRNNGVGVMVNQRPEFTCTSHAPQQGKRNVKMNYVWPLTEEVAGKSTIKGYYTLVVSAKFSEDATPTQLKEAAVQGLNVVSSALMKEVAETGFSPT